MVSMCPHTCSGGFANSSQMFKPVRVLASIIMLASIGLVFVGAFVLNQGVCLLFLATLSSCSCPNLDSVSEFVSVSVTIRRIR